MLETNNNQEKISIALIEKALTGDVRAFETIRDTIGEKPTQTIEGIEGGINVVINHKPVSVENIDK